VRATEGYTASLPGYHRALLPMNSSIIVTTPLPASVWDEIGWSDAETLRDGAHAYVYLQRTVTGRITIGGRGRPYRFGSRLGRVGVTPPSTVAALRQALFRLFPVLAQSAVTIDGAWSGVLGVARDWCPTVGIRRSADGGLAWAGGYVGDGVATSHLAGLTLADLILGRSTERTALPWVGHRARSWEPEPLRWLGDQAVYGLYRAADRTERRHADRPTTSRWADLASVLAGRS
jgi:glycine/D-amino acid oxidase-like deaminating enzyme